MPKELYFDISAEESGGSLFRLTDAAGKHSFVYNHSTYNAATDSLSVFETPYPHFEAFWKALTQNKPWHFMHPLFVHPEVRAFVAAHLETVNWKSGSLKWQQSHQRQWTKVLSGSASYYIPPTLK